MGTALATASYTSSRDWTFQSCGLKVDGTVIPVKSFTASGENSLDVDRHFLGSGTIAEPLRNELAAITGELACEWGNPAAAGTMNYHRFIGGTESALVFTMVSGTLEGTITANVRYYGATPNVEGRGITQHTIPWKAIASTTDASARARDPCVRHVSATSRASWSFFITSGWSFANSLSNQRSTTGVLTANCAGLPSKADCVTQVRINSAQPSRL